MIVAKYRARRRHARLMEIAEHLVRQASAEAEKVTCAQLAAVVFGRYQLRVEEAEAADFLAAALVEGGYSIDHLQAVRDQQKQKEQ
ncbi:hypothetical protein ACFYXM_34130 [Streptomyces sp. NPDC002476]|uniref:hypothetical protein n=1 Tax=Streptomyces sp. NPDC002476 TaxID=3364648 RepID=UPI0036BB18FD